MSRDHREMSLSETNQGVPYQIKQPGAIFNRMIASFEGATCTLAQLGRGCAARIIGYTCDDATTRRLCALGFMPGSTAELMRAAPLKDPLMFDVAGAEMVLRRREADRILVEL